MLAGENTMTHSLFRTALCTGFAVTFMLLSASAFAMGSSGGSSSISGPTGQSESDRLRQQYKKAVKAVEAKDFATAEVLLSDYVTKKKKSADAWNYLAFSQRNLGKNDEAMTNYNKALELDDEHKGALEYQGELYLKLGNVAAAQANLARLEKLCRKKCEERDVLQAAIERAKDGKMSWIAPERASREGN
jgi:predicted Zn-dependent protease